MKTSPFKENPAYEGNHGQPASNSLREYYAGLAMQGIIVNNVGLSRPDNPLVKIGEIEMSVPAAVAVSSVEFADALIAELKKKTC